MIENGNVSSTTIYRDQVKIMDLCSKIIYITDSCVGYIFIIGVKRTGGTSYQSIWYFDTIKYVQNFGIFSFDTCFVVFCCTSKQVIVRSFSLNTQNFHHVLCTSKFKSICIFTRGTLLILVGVLGIRQKRHYTSVLISALLGTWFQIIKEAQLKKNY